MKVSLIDVRNIIMKFSELTKRDLPKSERKQNIMITKWAEW